MKNQNNEILLDWERGFKDGRSLAISEIKVLIVAELYICHRDGTSTSRLTSLFNKVDDLLKKL